MEQDGLEQVNEHFFDDYRLHLFEDASGKRYWSWNASDDSSVENYIASIACAIDEYENIGGMWADGASAQDFADAGGDDTLVRTLEYYEALKNQVGL